MSGDIRYYTRDVIDHFRKPRNQRSIEAPDAEGRAINRACSDVVRVQIKVEDGKLKDVAFKAQGCVACVAAASMTTILAMGRPLDDAELSREEVAEALGGLPESKMDCSVIAPNALAYAVQQYLSSAAS
ncbi:MAG: iron-sulfur cluster assembly scaffold protein [Proteobacteria bacterium]|nr:iron-sulfur cluster assembly scaffold protein [Pseudomonadota bacterium]